MILRWLLVLSMLSIGWVSSLPRKDKDLIQVTNRCPMLTECPYNAEKCIEDDDCSVDAVCCKSPCGKVCTKQLFTGCQTLRMAASRRAKSLGVETKSVRMPRCNKQGSFEPIQCDNEIVSSCWCVDEAGFELPGTRAPAAALVNCTAPKACADATCRMFCPYGFALDKQGCPLCKCREPCDDIRCPNQLQCHLEDLACADPPCPPVPTCKKGRSLENVCPVGDPLRISDTVRPFLCGNNPGTPSCPPMYQCLVQKGSEYGVCCPASLKIQKTGTCPLPSEKNLECGNLCTHDLECPSVQKCCQTEACGASCIHPKNVTECFYQRALSEVLAVSEREGRGYVPQCTEDGQFKLKQCSRNGLVCWCVDRMGRKLKGSMGPSDSVECSHMEVLRDQSVARSLDKEGKECERLECAAVCEYGFKLGDDGCHTCKCDDPCDGYMCPEDEECVNVKESTCKDNFLCPSLPVCRPKAVYANPCIAGTPLTDDLSGAPVACALRSEDGTICPESYECTAVPGSTQAVCCPFEDEYEGEASEDYTVEARPQSMCEYLHEFSETMEGTKEGMTLALPSPECDKEGNYLPTQCDKKNGQCWCVDNFGTELPNSRSSNNNTDCLQLRKTMDCLEATCRMGCEYGFVLSKETGCPTCQCRDPCYGVSCQDDEQCQMVEVSCKDHYCPPVPACLPKKIGQCPYLVPATSTNCNFECNSDLACNGTMRCCSNGCGTQCIEPLLYTACQHQRSLAQHQAYEEGIPVGKVHMPACKPDGSYDPKQCNPSTNECWCVDDRGFEKSKTRTTKLDQLNCDVEDKNTECPLYNCRQDCEHGFEIDEDGCRTCRCVDPCDKITCRGDGESCRLVQVECVTWPCPPVPMCLPKKENPCQTGEPLKLGGNSDELVTCGPEFEGCPSSHKCQLSPVGEYAVCCPKPRDVCFESLKTESCKDQESTENSTRYYFNSTSNKCESFLYSGCEGNHNNFHSKATCDAVCPVLSQCERLREKNQRQSEKYKKQTFAPRCDPNTGAWQAIQCMENVGVCWCVTPTGEPLKGTITRGDNPVCNFRQARIWASDRSDDVDDLVLEQLLKQIEIYTSKNEDPPKEVVNTTDLTNLPSKSRCQALGGVCDESGRFVPTQCEEETCWCVDEAGNQLIGTNTFVKGERTCFTVPIETAEVTLGFHGNFDAISSIPVVNQVTKILQALEGNVNDQGIATEIDDDVLLIKFGLIGSNKVDVAYRLERMIMQQMIPGLTADITRSRVLHKLLPQDDNASESLTLEQREIVSQAPVSVVAPYHTALIVIAAASAFVISVLTVLVILYRRKMHSMTTQKIIDDGRFLANRPIYIELPSDKNSSNAVIPSPVESIKKC